MPTGIQLALMLHAETAQEHAKRNVGENGHFRRGVVCIMLTDDDDAVGDIDFCPAFVATTMCATDAQKKLVSSYNINQGFLIGFSRPPGHAGADHWIDLQYVAFF